MLCAFALVAAALAGVDFFYGLIYNGIAVFFPLYGHVWPTVLSSALLVPGYAFVAAVGYAYNEEARTRLDGLDIARAIARMQAVPVDAGSPAL